MFLPKWIIYTMLTIIKKPKKAFRSIIALLFFISCITIHTVVSANIKENTAEEYRALGYEEQQKGNLNEALSNYTKAISLGMENAVLLNDMGVLYEEIDLYGRAESFYLRSIQNNPKYLPPYNNLAYLYMRLGKVKKAARYFKMRFEFGDPTDPWAQKAKNELLKIDPSYRQWAMSLEAAVLDKQIQAKSQEEFYRRVKSSQEHYQRGSNLFDDENYEGALKEYNHALHYAPKNPVVIEARKRALIEISKKNVREQSEQAIKRLETGDTLAARYEIQKMLATIPDEPILLSP